MKKWLLDLLACPHCASEATLEVRADDATADEIVQGALSCAACGREYPVLNGIPRFVEPDENYAENFGHQWHQFREAQIDRLAGHDLSGTRLLADTRWTPEWIGGKLILDAGCGAGRFTDELAQNGARVVACDLSSAVDACKRTMDDPRGQSTGRGEVEIVQANLLAMPFRKDAFDAVHCAGVIQHTPDPKTIMRALPAHLKPGGRLFYNFYEIDPYTKFQVVKYLLRRWTPQWKVRNLVTFCRVICGSLFPLSWIMSRIPIVRFFNRFLPICSVHPAGMPLKQQFDLTLLDTIDWYGPQYEIRQSHKDVAALLVEDGLDEVSSAEGLAWAIKR